MLVLISSVAAQESQGETGKAPAKSDHAITNDDGKSNDTQSDDLPAIPGLIKCGKDLKCFLDALDKSMPAALTRSEIAQEGTALVTSESTWWTTEFSGDQCTVSFRVNAFDATVNEKVDQEDPEFPRDATEAKLAEMKRDFENIRGRVGTCSLAVKDFKILMTVSPWTLLSLGPASNFGKNCSGELFGASHGPPQSDRK